MKERKEPAKKHTENEERKTKDCKPSWEWRNINTQLIPFSPNVRALLAFTSLLYSDILSSPLLQSSWCFLHLHNIFQQFSINIALFISYHGHSENVRVEIASPTKKRNSWCHSLTSVFQLVLYRTNSSNNVCTTIPAIIPPQSPYTQWVEWVPICSDVIKSDFERVKSISSQVLPVKSVALKSHS